MEYFFNKLSLFLVSYVAISSVANLLSIVEGRVRLHKTIKTEYGNIYDCVDIYKQPAFDLPLLKNHKIQMRPSFALQGMSNDTSSTSNTKYGLKDECPRGTVPIQRISKEEQLRNEFSFPQDLERSATGFEFAGMSTKAGKYFAGGGAASIYNPSTQPGQFSSSVMSIEGGPPESFSTIRAGWMVNPSLFGDNRTRLYTIWGQGVDGAMHGCYDTRCPGFVIVNTKIPLNLAFNDISVIYGTQFYVKLQIDQDTASGNWWLRYGEKLDADPDQQIGYWPNKLFTNLKQGAEVIRWGGMVYSSSSVSPPMGSGRSRSCHYRRITTAAAGNIDAPFEKSESRCYIVRSNSYKNDLWGYSFSFAGEGGDTNQCHQ